MKSDFVNTKTKFYDLKKEESLEDLQKTFVELFGDDLLDMMEERDDPKVRKRACDSGSSAQAIPKRSARV